VASTGEPVPRFNEIPSVSLTAGRGYLVSVATQAALRRAIRPRPLAQRSESILEGFPARERCGIKRVPRGCLTLWAHAGGVRCLVFLPRVQEIVPHFPRFGNACPEGIQESYTCREAVLDRFGHMCYGTGGK